MIASEARHAVPLGLYPKCPWDHRTLKKMVLEKKVAPIFKGEEDPSRDDLEECPICMLVRYATRTHTHTHESSASLGLGSLSLGRIPSVQERHRLTRLA